MEPVHATTPLHGHPDDELGELAWRQRPASTSAGTAVVLLGDQSAVPAENRVGRDDACHLHQCPSSEFRAAHCESAALGVGQAKWSTSELLAEDPILLSQIVDQILLVAVQPASEGEDEELQSMGHRPRLRREDTATTGPALRFGLPRPIICTLRHRLLPAVQDSPLLGQGCSGPERYSASYSGRGCRVAQGRWAPPPLRTPSRVGGRPRPDADQLAPAAPLKAAGIAPPSTAGAGRVVP